MAEQQIIVVNGSERPYVEQTVFELLESLGINPATQGIAVAVNGEVVARSLWKEFRLKPLDRVEIVTAVAGG